MITLTKAELWNLITKGEVTEDPNLPKVDGRIDLRGLKLPKPAVANQRPFAQFQVRTILPSSSVRGAKLHELDLTGSSIPSLRLFDAEIRNCVLDRCNLADLRMWSTTVANCGFRSTKLRGAALGGIDNGKRNMFLNVDFSDADMRETAYKSASFTHCRFRNTRLEGTNFQGSTFQDCVFEGEVRNVLFNRSASGGEDLPPNQMLNVDFSRATLRFVGFRGLTLDHVVFPQDTDHFVIRDFDSALDRVLRLLSAQADEAARKLVFFLENERKWVVPNQAQGVVNALDLREVAGDEGLERFRAALNA